MASPSRADRPRRRPIPTRRGIATAAGIAVVAALAPLLPVLGAVWPILAILLLLALVYEATAGVGSAAAKVALKRSVSELDHVGRQGRFRIDLTNESSRPLSVTVRATLPPYLEGRDVIWETRLAPGESQPREVDYVCLRRGRHQLPAVGVRIARPGGLLAFQGRSGERDFVTVGPGRPGGETAWLLARAGMLEQLTERRVRRLGSSWEFDSMREYVVGDELRRMDWKASARRHRPMVRVHRSERNADVILALDCGRLMGSLIDGASKLDLTMTPVLDLAAVALRRRDQVGLLLFDASPRAFVPPRAGSVQLRLMTEALSRVAPGTEPTSYLGAIQYLEAHHRKRSLIVIFTDFTDELSARDMIDGLVALARRHVLLFVAVGDPNIERIFRDDDPREAALFQKAVAGKLLLERRQTLALLEQRGVACVDAEPKRLTGRLLRRYLEVRLKGVM